jgi:hypothetical protein
MVGTGASRKIVYRDDCGLADIRADPARDSGAELVRSPRPYWDCAVGVIGFVPDGVMRSLRGPLESLPGHSIAWSTRGGEHWRNLKAECFSRSSEDHQFDLVGCMTGKSAGMVPSTTL